MPNILDYLFIFVDNQILISAAADYASHIWIRLHTLPSLTSLQQYVHYGRHRFALRSDRRPHRISHSAYRPWQNNQRAGKEIQHHDDAIIDRRLCAPVNMLLSICGHRWRVKWEVETTRSLAVVCWTASTRSADLSGPGRWICVVLIGDISCPECEEWFLSILMLFCVMYLTSISK